MKERIDIVIPDERLAQNAAKIDRLDRAMKFQPTDRTPVVVDPQLWACLAGRGGSFAEMCGSPREHLRGQILNYKWRAENIPDDQPIETESLTIQTDFGALRGVEFPMAITFDGELSPKTNHLLHDLTDIDTLTIPPPDGGFNRQRIDWYFAMREMAEDFDVRVNGEPLTINIDLTHPGGPIPSAFALCGANLFLWMMMDPERVHQLMQIATDSHLQVIEYFAELTGRPVDHPVWSGCDTGEMMNPDMFREFVAPYYLQVWEKHPGPRTYHMCGAIDHILDILRDDMAITYLNGFGFPADPQLLGEKLGGKVVLRGGPHPVLIHDGPEEEIIKVCTDYIEQVGHAGGYILCEGFGLMPGTPASHIEAMIEASRRAGPPLS